jgi:cytochrome b561
MSHTPVTKYSSLSKLFHWVIALAVILMLSAGFFLDDLPEQFQGTAYMLHKSTGITLLFLMLLRFIWIHAVGKPALPTAMRLWEKMLSRVVQYGLYLLLIMMPLSGWIMSVAENRDPIYFGLFKASLPWVGENQSLSKFMAESHETIAWILIAFITLHILGALKHHFINKDTILRRMLPGKNN